MYLLRMFQRHKSSPIWPTTFTDLTGADSAASCRLIVLVF
jgi:hypothetical protein